MRWSGIALPVPATRLTAIPFVEVHGPRDYDRCARSSRAGENRTRDFLYPKQAECHFPTARKLTVGDVARVTAESPPTCRLLGRAYARKPAHALDLGGRFRPGGLVLPEHALFSLSYTQMMAPSGIEPDLPPCVHGISRQKSRPQLASPRSATRLASGAFVTCRPAR